MSKLMSSWSRPNLIWRSPGADPLRLSACAEVRTSWLSRILEDGTALREAPEDLRGDRAFLLDAVRATKAPWLVQLASKALQDDAELVDQVKHEAGTGLVFTWYRSPICFFNMRDVIVATGASVPGGEAYEEVMKRLNATEGGAWAGAVAVVAGNWVHSGEEGET